MSFWERGKVYCSLNADYFEGGEKERYSLASELNIIKIFDYKAKGVENGRDSSGLLDELDDEEFELFIKVLDKYCY